MNELLELVDDQEIDFVKPKNTPTEHKKERLKLLCFDDELQAVLEDAGCWIAGGAVTSVFTGKEINDIDVYFPSKDAFCTVMAEIYAHDRVDYRAARLCHITDKSILLSSAEQDVQFIVFKFFDSVEDIFNSFDFTAVMGAYSMKDGMFHLHPDFLKHNAQRFLRFNKRTDFPLISMLRVDKYRERGYTTSKQEMLKIGMAIANKDFSNWQRVIDEVGSMYGLNPDEIFDQEKKFSLDEVISQLDNLFIPKHYKNIEPPCDLFQLAKKMPDKMSDSMLDYIAATKDKDPWDRETYFEFIKEKETPNDQALRSEERRPVPSPFFTLSL